MTLESVIKELHEIAKELKLPFDNHEVLTQRNHRYGGMPKEMADIIFPIYTDRLEKIYGVRMEDGIVTHIRKTKDSNYEPILD